MQLETEPIPSELPRRLGWKIYAVALAAMLPLGYALVFATRFGAFAVLDFVFSCVGLAGLFGYAFRRRILPARLWAVWAFVLPCWDLTSNFVYEVSAVSTVVAMVVLAPKYVALWRYSRELSGVLNPSPADR